MAEILLVASSSGQTKQRCPDLATFPLFKMDKVELSLVQLSGLILSGCVGKHADSLAQELVVNTEGKTDCQEWDTDGWKGYQRMLPETVDHYRTHLGST
jgi:hypothetical protein